MLEVSARLHRQSVQATAEALARPRRGDPDPDALARAAEYVDGWMSVLPWPPSRGPCVPRSLVLFALSRRFGLDLRVHMGVRRDGGSLEGHAWLYGAGRPWLEPEDPGERYVTTLVLPSAPPPPGDGAPAEDQRTTSESACPGSAARSEPER